MERERLHVKKLALLQPRLPRLGVRMLVRTREIRTRNSILLPGIQQRENVVLHGGQHPFITLGILSWLVMWQRTGEVLTLSGCLNPLKPPHQAVPPMESHAELLTEIHTTAMTSQFLRTMLCLKVVAVRDRLPPALNMKESAQIQPPLHSARDQ